MKIGILTTINTNIGDDFIRIGIENVINSIRREKGTQFTHVNKHHPESIITPTEIFQILSRLPSFKGKQRLINLFYSKFNHSFNIFKKQELIIQSGAPVLWPNCFNSEWNMPFWYETAGKLHNQIPVLNLAAGSCYPWENQKGFLDERELQFAKDIGSFSTLTTVRDKLAHQLFNEAETKSHLIPCSAFLVNPEFKNTETGKYILINYMHAGGHFDWKQNIDAKVWESSMKEVILALNKHHEVRFICHNQKEFDLAFALNPEIKIHFPKNSAEYMECIKNAKAGINNRMHASVAMASFGIPSISVCTDTRLLMLDLLGLPIFYVKNAFVDELISTINSCIDNSAKEKNRLFELKQNTFEKYRDLLQPFCK